VPALIALNFGTVGRTITVVLGIVVAAATGVEHFLNSGQRWRHYRGTAELMKSEAWLYLELAGDYARYSRHDAAFSTFVARAEALMRDEVREYVTAIVAERRKPADTNVPGER
jgi:nitrate reductase alpha subunit